MNIPNNMVFTDPDSSPSSNINWPEKMIEVAMMLLSDVPSLAAKRPPTLKKHSYHKDATNEEKDVPRGVQVLLRAKAAINRPNCALEVPFSRESCDFNGPRVFCPLYLITISSRYDFK